MRASLASREALYFDAGAEREAIGAEGRAGRVRRLEIGAVDLVEGPHSFMSASITVHLTTLRAESPFALSVAMMLSMTCRYSSSGAASCSVPGRLPI